MYPRDTEVQLEGADLFDYTGYSFDQWVSLSGEEYEAGSTVSNLAEPGQMIVMNASWNAHKYTIQYVANKPGHASANVQNMPADMVCTYDTDVTLGSAPSLNGWTFGGWYRDAACTVKIGNADEIKANLTDEQNGVVSLYAKWAAKTYTITYDANGGTGTTNQSTHSYDTEKELSGNGYSRGDHVFLGWSMSSTSTAPTYTDRQSVKNLAMSGNITLYAVWLKTRAVTGYYNRTSDWITSKSGEFGEAYYPGMDKAALLANGYKAFKLTFYVDGYGEGGLQVWDDPYIDIYSYKDEHLATKYLGGYPSKGWDTHTVEYTISLEHVQSDGSFWVIFRNDHSLDGWKCGSVEVHFEAVK